MASKVAPLGKVPNNIQYELDHGIKYNLTLMTNMHGTTILQSLQLAVRIMLRCTHTHMF